MIHEVIAAIYTLFVTITQKEMGGLQPDAERQSRSRYCGGACTANEVAHLETDPAFREWMAGQGMTEADLNGVRRRLAAYKVRPIAFCMYMSTSAVSACLTVVHVHVSMACFHSKPCRHAHKLKWVLVFLHPRGVFLQ
jgi:hypothetical protein